MTKKFASLGLAYGILAMAFGVFYREFTKFQGFTGKTALSVTHTHYFLLGMFFFLLLMVIEKAMSFSDANTEKLVLVYQVGLNIAGAAFLLRGYCQVRLQNLERAMDAAISGVAGIGHILIAVCMVLLLLKIQKAAGKERKAPGK